MGKIIGIDLGTTNTVAAIMDGTRPKVIDTFESRPSMRSVVGLKRARGRNAAQVEREILVGDVAVDNWAMAPEDTIVSIKRLMGRAFNDSEVQRVRSTVTYAIERPIAGTEDGVCVVMGGRQHTPTDISAMILGRAKKAAEAREGAEVTHAIITVPAYFGHSQKDATRKAALQAGLKVIKILDEPTAAAIAFGVEAGVGDAYTLLVYDLGGGTFDVSVLTAAGGVFAQLNLQGDMWLGGDDFDQAIMDDAVARIGEDFGLDPRSERRFMVELRKAAQQLKERLSSALSADLVVSGLLRDSDGDLIDVDLHYTREQFERLIVPLVGRYRPCGCGAANLPTDTVCHRCGTKLPGGERKGKALAIVEKALLHAQLTKDQVDFVIMAGNSTMVPLVQSSMEEAFGAKKVLRKIHPKHCVALGAAIAAARLGEQVVCQAPDLSDSTGKRECGHVNQPGAAQCTKCGAPLGAGRSGGRSAGGAAPDDVPTVIDVHSVAPFAYGTQSAGDKFNVFIKKGDYYPTPPEAERSLTFYTGRANQRMVVIPVYGGENLEVASANEKQGDAFAVLPAGLPQGTSIRVLLTLDDAGVFKIGAWLGNATDLKPWIVHGGSDARVIQLIESLEERLARPQYWNSEAEQALEAVYTDLAGHRFEQAMTRAETLLTRIEKGPGVDDDPRKQADALLGFSDFLAREFGWLMERALAAKLAAASAAVADAYQRNDLDQLRQILPALNRVIDELPEAIQVLVAVLGAILGEVRPANPGLGDQLHREFTSAMDDIKRGDGEGGRRRLDALMARVTDALRQIGKAVQCVNARCRAELPPGTRTCPSCHTPQNILTTGQASAAGGTARFIETR